MIRKSVLLLAATMLLNNLSFAQGITVFDLDNFQGESLVIKSDWSYGVDNPNWNDRISSIRIPEGYKIQVFLHGLGSESKTFSNDVRSKDLGNLNNNISAIKFLSFPPTKSVETPSIPRNLVQQGTFVSNAELGKYSVWNSNFALNEEGLGAVVFQAKGTDNIHIAFSDAATTKAPMYEVVLGGWKNTRSVIRKVSQGKEVASSKLVLPIIKEATYFWASVDKSRQLVSAGTGNEVGKNILVEYTDKEFLEKVKYVSFSSWETTVEYSLLQLVEVKPLPKVVKAAVRQELRAEGVFVSEGAKGTYPVWDNNFGLFDAGLGAIKFSAKGANNFHVAFSSKPSTADPMYEVVLGAQGNKISAIRKKSQGKNLAESQKGVYAGADSLYWIWVDKSTKRVSAGTGRELGKNILVELKDSEFLNDVKYVSFSSLDSTVVYSQLQIAAIDSFYFQTDKTAYEYNKDEVKVKFHYGTYIIRTPNQRKLDQIKIFEIDDRGRETMRDYRYFDGLTKGEISFGKKLPAKKYEARFYFDNDLRATYPFEVKRSDGW